MNTSMVQCVALTVLILLFRAARGVAPEPEALLRAGALELPWQEELCCESPLAHIDAEGGSAHGPEANRSEPSLPHRPRCRFTGSAAGSHPHRPSGGTCLDIMCRLMDWESLTCDLQPRGRSSGTGLMAISLQRLLSQRTDSSDNPVVCEAADSFLCSVPLNATTGFVTAVTISVSDAIAPQVLLRVPARPDRPSAPFNLSHHQTIDAELILQWDDPSDQLLDAGPLRYQVRYSPNRTHPAWQVESTKESRVSLDLKPKLNYTIQVRSSGLNEPPLWSDWSKQHHIYLNTVTYIPEKVVARPGDNVTVYCVFNDHSVNASSAVWMLNLQQQSLDPSQYHTVNQRVSRITVRPPETHMYHLLQCTQQWNSPYSQIYVEGAVIDIRCETNGNVDAMVCSWNHTHMTRRTLGYSWAHLPCDIMEESERAGKKLHEMQETCPQDRSQQQSCTIRPLRMNCYKLWLELPPQLGPVRSKPIYLSPIDYVKPHAPTNVTAVTQSRGVLVVTWNPPSFPVKGFQYQFAYSLSTIRDQPEWRVQSPTLIPRAEVPVPNMCRVYVVQVRCLPLNGTGYWSDWSKWVYSTPQNSRAPERGPDFWRVLQDDPLETQTKVTLLFKQVPKSGDSYCVDGFIVQYQTSASVVNRERMEVASYHSFRWSRKLLTVTVEAYNSVGSSANNIHMTLDTQPKRSCVRSFHVSVVNSTCVSVSWSLLDNSSKPLFMVVQWLPQRQQDADLHKDQTRDTWARLPYTDRPVHLRGDFFDSENLGFYLHPVFADGEGEAVYATATRVDPAAYVMLVIISFLSIVLLVTLVLSQNQMKRFVWKDVPNPQKCSWAKELDLKKGDTFQPLFQTAEGSGQHAWPPLLPSEHISKVVIEEKFEFSALTSALINTPLVSLSPDPATKSCPPRLDSKSGQALFLENELHPVGAPASAVKLPSPSSSHPRIDELLPADRLPVATDCSAQSSVTYATVLHSNAKRADTDPRHYKDGSGSSSSSDEGNFSANNSDISGSFPRGLWELDSCRGGDMEDPRRSCSYNSVEELSETSEQQDEREVKEEKDLFYLGMDHLAEDEEREEEAKTGLLKSVFLNTENSQSFFLESNPLLAPDDSGETNQHQSTGSFSPLYLPQFRTAPSYRQPHDGKPHL